MRAAVVGIAGLALDTAEHALFCRTPPAGVILFGRNIADPAQLAALVAALRAVLPPPQAVLMVDQEGGRVARLRPPHWLAHPPAAAIGRLGAADARRAAWLQGALIGMEAAAAGFDVVCAPVLDVRRPGASAVVGDRAFSDQPGSVARLGRAMAEGLLAAGVQPVAKHAPGHGAATVDSHAALPVVEQLAAADLRPFQDNADLPWMMTAHVVYRDIDPEHPATVSARLLGGVLRRQVGFDGLLVSDDLAMHALAGPPAQRAARALQAGCDLALYCPGDAAGTAAVLQVAPDLSAAAARRLEAARLLAAGRRTALDSAMMHRERSALVA